MIAERTFRLSHVGTRMTNESEFRFGHQTVGTASRIFRHAQFLSAKQ